MSNLLAVENFPDWTLFIAGLVLISALAVLIIREIFALKPRKTTILSGFGLAMLGLAMSQGGRIAKITAAGWSVELVNKTKDDAATIDSIKTRVENQSATIDLVARNAGKAEDSAASAEEKLKLANARLEELDSTILNAKKSLQQLNNKDKNKPTHQRGGE